MSEAVAARPGAQHQEGKECEAVAARPGAQHQEGKV